MKIRVKSLLLLGTTLLCLIYAVYGVSSSVMMESHLALEHEEVLRNTERAERAILQRLVSLHEQSVDWSNWDDSYRFMKDKNGVFVKANLTDTSLQDLNLDAMLFIAQNGTLFFSKTTRHLPEQIALSPQALYRRLKPQLLKGKDGTAGLLMFNGLLLQVSSRPIYPTSKQGTPRGWIVFCHSLSKADTADLSEQTRLSLSLHAPNSQEIPPQALSELHSKKTIIAVLPRGERQISGYTLLKDMEGAPMQVLRITTPRHIYAQAQQNRRSLMGMVILVGILFGSLTLFALEKFVLARMMRLSTQVAHIGASGEEHGQVTLEGNDELGDLARRINAMLMALSRTTQRLRSKEHEIQRHSLHLEQALVTQEETNVLLREALERITHQAFHDALTGLPNRTLFAECVEQALQSATKSAQKVAVLFLDLDNFKVVNDSLGHEEGDRLLVLVAGRLQEAVPEGQRIARLGGDEFTILLDAVEGEAEALAVAENILERLRSPIRLHSREVIVSASVGVALCAGGEANAETLLRNADVAMYQAKGRGKSAYILFQEQMNGAVLERLEMEMELRKAIERGQFQLLYQPIVDLQTGRICGAEALARWFHPEWGQISPTKFIPIAEEMGLIVPLGEWALEEACREAQAWRHQGAIDSGFVLNVNLATRQLQEANLGERFARILQRTGFPAHQLKLEITESAMMTDLEENLNRLNELRLLGVSLALDDFGTGYSSLASLRSLPVNTVKVDKSFIQSLNTGEANAILEAIFTLCHALNLSVVSEGIETQEQLLQVQALGCEYGQGYYFAKPLSAENLVQKLQAEASQRGVGFKKAA